MSAEQRQRHVDDLVEEIAIVRRYYDPVGDMAIVSMLNQLHALNLRRVRTRMERN